jgi:hypothetical protein
VTKSKLVGRGGARAGAGRKPKPVAGPTYVAGERRSDGEQSPAADTPAAPIIPAGLSEEEIDKFCRAVARDTLLTIAMTGTSESARVAASRELNDRSLGKLKPGTAAKADQSDLFESDGWGDLLKTRQPAPGRAN